MICNRAATGTKCRQQYAKSESRNGHGAKWSNVQAQAQPLEATVACNDNAQISCVGQN